MTDNIVEPAGPEFEFVAQLPPKAVRRFPDGLLDRFAAALRERPGQWAKWPVAGPCHGGYSSDIKRGWLKPFRRSEFDAITRNGVLYVRYIGDEAR